MFHRPYLVGAPQPEGQIVIFVSEMRDRIREYVSAMRVTPEFANLMLEIVPESMRLYRGAEIHKLVAERDAVYDEMKVASDARHGHANA